MSVGVGDSGTGGIVSLTAGSPVHQKPVAIFRSHRATDLQLQVVTSSSTHSMLEVPA
jgi:hypothetical protein